MVYALKFDSDTLRKRGVALDALTGDALGGVIVQSLNDTLDEAYDLARERMVTGINLTDRYLRRKMVLKHATPTTAKASVTAEGNETQLRNFGANLLLVPRVTTKPNRNQGKIGIPQGMKQYGSSIQVPKAGRERFPFAFLMPLNKGTEAGGNGLGVFTRAKGAEKPRVMLGPAVYQLFKYQLNGTLLDETEEALAKTLADQVEAAMTKALSE